MILTQYIVVIHRADEGGYWAEVPALPGCFAQGETLDESLEEAREAIASQVAALREDGQRVAPDDVMVASVAVTPPLAHES